MALTIDAINALQRQSVKTSPVKERSTHNTLRPKTAQSGILDFRGKFSSHTIIDGNIVRSRSDEEFKAGFSVILPSFDRLSSTYHFARMQKLFPLLHSDNELFRSLPDPIRHLDVYHTAHLFAQSSQHLK